MILVLVLSVCLWACRSVNVGTYEAKDSMRTSKIVENVMANTPTYAKASYKFSCEYSANGGVPDSFSGILRVQRDSLMWVSLRSFNIEGFRVLISSDSVKIMNRIKNEYYVEGISALESFAKLDMSYNDLQSILLNEFFRYPFDGDTTKKYDDYDYKSCIDTVYYCISTISQKKLNKIAERGNSGYAERHGSVVQTVKVVPGTFKVKNVYLEDLESGRNAFVEYGKFTRMGEQLFPQTMNIYVEAGDFNGVMKFSISDFEVNDELTFPFKVPAKYTKIKLNEKNR